MKLIGIRHGARSADLRDAEMAVQHVVSQHMRNYDCTQERENARSEALQGMLGRLIGAMIDNGTLRADQVDAIFDYDVTTEHDTPRRALDPNDPNNESRN